METWYPSATATLGMNNILEFVIIASEGVITNYKAL